MFKEAGETASHLVSFLSLTGNLDKTQKWVDKVAPHPVPVNLHALPATLHALTRSHENAHPPKTPLGPEA